MAQNTLLLFLFCYFILISIGDDIHLDLLLIRHIESAYNAGSIVKKGDKDSRASPLGEQQLGEIDTLFGEEAFKDKDLSNILSESVGDNVPLIRFEGSDLRRALLTALAARHSMIDYAEKDKSLGVALKNLQNAVFYIEQDLREEKDIYHIDSVSLYKNEWRNNNVAKKDLSDNISFIEYLADGLSYIEDKKQETEQERKSKIKKNYLTKNIKLQYEGSETAEKGIDGKKLSVKGEIERYGAHLKREYFKGTRLFIGGAHSKWIQHFIQHYGGGGKKTAIWKQYIKALPNNAKDEKVPNGAAIWMRIQIPFTSIGKVFVDKVNGEHLPIKIVEIKKVFAHHVSAKMVDYQDLIYDDYDGYEDEKEYYDDDDIYDADQDGYDDDNGLWRYIYWFW